MDSMMIRDRDRMPLPGSRRRWRSTSPGQPVGNHDSEMSSESILQQSHATSIQQTKLARKKAIEALLAQFAEFSKEFSLLMAEMRRIPKREKMRNDQRRFKKILISKPKQHIRKCKVLSDYSE